MSCPGPSGRGGCVCVEEVDVGKKMDGEQVLEMEVGGFWIWKEFD